MYSRLPWKALYIITSVFSVGNGQDKAIHTKSGTKINRTASL